jgi:hypothetical protein
VSCTDKDMNLMLMLLAGISGQVDVEMDSMSRFDVNVDFDCLLFYIFNLGTKAAGVDERRD